VAKADKRERQRQNREAARLERERLMKRDRRLRAARNLAFVVLPVVVILVILQITSGGDSGSSKRKPSGKAQTFKTAPKMTIDVNKTYTAVMKTTQGTITMELDPKAAPVATNNFVFLARKKFYDGLTFHRVAEDFVIQGGDPKGDGSGGPGYTVKGEVPTDHYPVGALAAAKGPSDPAGTMGSQFFIVTGSKGATLPNDYARFGKVTAGLDVAQKIEKLVPAGQSGYDGAPSKVVTIDSVRITEQ
jgi:cyclophilin family peptidyl-prolyl cis-trans isomerase